MASEKWVSHMPGPSLPDVSPVDIAIIGGGIAGSSLAITMPL